MSVPRAILRLSACAGLLLALSAGPGAAQTPVCVTARAQCPMQAMQPPGTACFCPGNPAVTGFVTVLNLPAMPYYQTPEPRRRAHLRNDDLWDDDDVLAGPRWHHRRDRDRGPDRDGDLLDGN